jgi:nicotinate-nucleotide pyrophosphorylase (carboxylating)
MTEHNETLEQARARNIRDALAEDVGRGDWTALLVPAAQRVRARVITREAHRSASSSATRVPC